VKNESGLPWAVGAVQGRDCAINLTTAPVLGTLHWKSFVLLMKKINVLLLIKGKRDIFAN